MASVIDDLLGRTPDQEDEDEAEQGDNDQLHELVQDLLNTLDMISDDLDRRCDDAEDDVEEDKAQDDAEHARIAAVLNFAEEVAALVVHACAGCDKEGALCFGCHIKDTIGEKAMLSLPDVMIMVQKWWSSRERRGDS